MRFLFEFICLFFFLPNGMFSYVDLVTKYAEDTLAHSHGEIIFSSVLFRHGERTIKERYPTDPYPESIWKGFLQLTKRGKEQVYELGKWYRKRYRKLLGDDGYNRSAIIIDSTHSDRALMSAELFLAGMFPPTEEEMWSSDGLEWQPIPVHTAPSKLDPILGVGANCPRMIREEIFWSSSAKAQAFYKKFKDTYEYTCEHAGYSKEECSDWDVFKSSQLIWNVYNALFIEESNNMTLPDWTKKIYPEPSRTISVYYFVSKTYSSELKRLKGGPLLGKMVKEMKSKRDGNTTKKVHVYSAQESTISIFLNTLSVFNNMIPEYVASVLVELRQKGPEYYVTVLYRNSTKEPPHLLSIPDCEQNCTLEKFIEATKYLIIVDFEKECQLHHSDPSNITKSIDTPTLIAVIFACSLLVIGTLVIFCKNFQIIRRKSFTLHYDSL